MITEPIRPHTTLLLVDDHLDGAATRPTQGYVFTSLVPTVIINSSTTVRPDIGVDTIQP